MFMHLLNSMRCPPFLTGVVVLGVGVRPAEGAVVLAGEGLVVRRWCPGCSSSWPGCGSRCLAGSCRCPRLRGSRGRTGSRSRASRPTHRRCDKK